MDEEATEVPLALIYSSIPYIHKHILGFSYDQALDVIECMEWNLIDFVQEDELEMAVNLCEEKHFTFELYHLQV